VLFSYFFKVNMLFGIGPAWQYMAIKRHVSVATGISLQGLRFLPITTYPYDAYDEITGPGGQVATGFGTSGSGRN
jgi:hypothetical protein